LIEKRRRPFLEAAAIEQAGQRVGMGLGLERLITSSAAAVNRQSAISSDSSACVSSAVVQ